MSRFRLLRLLRYITLDLSSKWKEKCSVNGDKEKRKLCAMLYQFPGKSDIQSQTPILE